MGNPTKRIIVEARTSGTQDLHAAAASLDKLGKSAKSLSGNFGFLTNGIKGWLGYLSVTKLASLSDQMQNISNRLKIVTGSADEAKIAFASLVEVSDRTNQGISETGEIYTRLANSLKAAGLNTGELSALTETLINTFRVSGANATETTNTIIQLAQAFSSGELRGQELRSVMEQNAILAGFLRKELGQDIYKKAKEGAITITQVMEILVKRQKEVNEQAKLLTPTFEQTLTKAMNKLALGMKKLNEEFRLADIFARLVKTAVDNLGLIVGVVGGALTAFAIKQTLQLGGALATLKGTLITFAQNNPYIAAMAAIAAITLVAYNNSDKLNMAIKKGRILILERLADLKDLEVARGGSILSGDAVDKRASGITAAQNLEQTKKEAIALRRQIRDIQSDLANGLLENIKKEPKSIEEQMKSMLGKINNFQKKKSREESPKEMLAGLNNLLTSKQIDIGEYQKRLNKFEKDKINIQFGEGKMDVFARNAQRSALNIKELNRELVQGDKNFKQYTQAVEADKFQILNEQMRAGLITLQEYNNELLKMGTMFSESSPFKVGVTNYMESVGTLAENIAKGVEKTLSALEDGLVDFVKTGKINFRDFANSVIDEIIRIQVRMAIAGLISNITGSFAGATASSGASSGGGSPTLGNDYSGGLGTLPSFANGGVMTSRGMMPLHSYASGGIARSPQMAMFGEGRMPEAYVPLPNGRSIPVEMNGGGSTNVVVNVNLESGSSSVSSDSKSAEKLGVIISNVVKKELINQKRNGGIL